MKKYLITFLFIFINLINTYGEILPPENIKVIFWGDSIELRWEENTNTQISHYIIYRSTFEDLDDTNYGYITWTAGNLNYYIDANINTLNNYYYRIQTVDTNSNTSTLTSIIKAFPYPPTNIDIIPFNTEILLKWDRVSDTNVAQYNVYRYVPDTSLSLTQTVSTNEFIDKNLINGYEYFYKITSISSQEGPESKTVSAVPFVRPLPPKNVTYNIYIDTDSLTKVSISWSDEEIKGTYDISGYNIYKSTESNNLFYYDFITSTTYVDTISNTGTFCYYSIQTVDIKNNTSTGYTFNFYISGTPQAPKNLTITSYTANSITLLWDYSPSEEGVTSYQIYRETAVINSTSLNYYIDANISPGNFYTYYVTAINSYGESEKSNSVGVTPVPSAPQNVTVYPGDIFGSLSLTWSPNSVEENVYGYNIYRSTDSNFNFSSPITITTNTSFVDTSLITGNVYYYCLNAITITGVNTINGRVSEVVYAKSITKATAPLNITGTSYNTYVYLEWEDLSDNYDVSQYNIYRSTDGIIYSLAGTSSQNYYYDTGLTNGVGYFYKISSINYYGESDLSNPICLTPTSGNIDSPKNLTLTSNGDGCLYLSWSEGKEEDNILGYNIYRSTISSFYTNIYATVTNTSYIDCNCNTLTTYYYTVSAYNSITESSISNEVYGFSFIKPYKVRNVDLSFSDDKVILVWDPPEYPYTYQTITKYNIYRSTSASGSYSLIENNYIYESYIDDDINTSVSTYNYKIKVVDDMGNEDDSTDYYSVSINSLLSPPVTLDCIEGDGFVTLLWKKVTPTPDSYVIYRSTIPNYFIEPLVYGLGFDSKEYKDTIVYNGTTYYYTISAVNSAGEGPKSNEVSATPYKKASLPQDTGIYYEIRDKKDIYISWNQAIDGDYPIMGYDVLRSNDGGGYYTFLTFTSNTYYLDTDTEWDNLYFYMIKAVDSKGNTDVTYPLIKVELPAPSNKLRVYKNLVDLSKGERLKLKYRLIEAGHVKVKIYTLSGIYVTTLIDEKIEGNITKESPYDSEEFFWDGRNKNGKKVGEGVYLLMFEINKKISIEKVAVIK